MTRLINKWLTKIGKSSTYGKTTTYPSKTTVYIVWLFPIDSAGSIQFYGVFSSMNDALAALDHERDNLASYSIEHKIESYIVDYRKSHPAIKYWRPNDN